MLQETPSLLSVAAWGRYLGTDPVHLQQVSVPSTQTSATQCGEPAMQWSWQSAGRVGREDIAQAIQTAEGMIRSEIGFSPLPDWYRNEYNLHDQLNPTEVMPWATFGVGGRARTIRLQNGYFIGGGVEAQTLISAGESVAYTSPNNDPSGYARLATVGPVATTVTDPNQIALYMTTGDTHLAAGAAPGEIRPITVSIAGGFVTITFATELAVLPDLVTALEPQAVDGTDSANFVAEVDVYRRYTDPSTSAVMGWQPMPGCGWCGTTDCAACSEGLTTGCLLQTDERRSVAAFHPATYDADANTWTATEWTYWRAPDFVRSYYRAGWRDERQPRPYYDMDPLFARAVVALSTSLLDRPFCGCDSVSEAMQRWQIEYAQSAGNDAGSLSWQTSQMLLDSQWGTRYGAVWAWQQLRKYLIGRGLKAG